MRGRISLTFDDGPDPRWTPRILDALRTAGARATFFVLAPRAVAHPELIERMRAEGHAVELHAWAHVRHTELSAAAGAQDTDRALAALGTLGVRPRRWRTPWGATADWTAPVAEAGGLELVHWTADTHDWRGDRAADMLAAIDDDVRDGAIVLCHDALGPGATRDGCAETVALIEPLVALARARGLEPEPRVSAVADDPAALGLATALQAVAAGAAARDRDLGGRFPLEAVAALERAGAFAPPRGTYAEELTLLRAVARADLGVARILDGHLNAVERLRVHAAPDLRELELAAIAAGSLRAGVWGADPDPALGEGDPAVTDGHIVRGAKTFCSGAGGLDRALVLVRHADDQAGPPLAAWVDLGDASRVRVDHSWFRGGGMRSSASHRVVFDDAPVLALLGGPGALVRQPWFTRDAVRTAATWAGAADAAADDALAQLSTRPRNDLSALAAGEILMLRRTIDLWLEEGGRALEATAGATPADMARLSAHLRGALAAAIRALLDAAERALGSRPAATGTPLDRSARDLRLFLLQHRLEPLVARTGAAALEALGA